MTGDSSHILLRAFSDELARCGVEHACTSPGSRSAPIVLALVREQRIRCWSHIDERCGAFFALGAAKASGRPVAIACTSGTAAANFAPAVIEAHHAGVPLIVLTADRPPELRDNGAGQAIDQLRLYGAAAKWFFEVGFEDASPAGLRWIRTLACRAYWTAVGGRPGPVHLNFPLREPLVPSGPLPLDTSARPGGEPWVSVDESVRGGRDSIPRRHEFSRTVFVAGTLGSDARLGPRLAEFAARARVPLLADPLSNARRGRAAIAHYDLLLRDPVTATALAPQVVCRIGELPTSKPLRAWLAGLDVPQIAFAADDGWSDPDSMLIQRTITPLRHLLDRIERDEVMPDASDWLEHWRAADQAAADVIAAELGDALSEPRVAAELGARLPAGASVFVASSMPVRDVEEFWPVRDDGPRLLANRGANGIDGTVSAAFGAVAVSDGPVVLLIGDVALAHDVGGLLASRRLGLSLTIVLLNNDGGGIFHFLPVASAAEVFEEHVATPHGLAFEHAARLYGCQYAAAESMSEFREQLDSAVADRHRTTIIEVRTVRAANRALHRTIEDRVRTAVNRPTSGAAPGA
jgi:2-succinyl-5-enolpyruvyl-6-hydroxy-3-cyclohexene-1-carboxylate synthase